MIRAWRHIAIAMATALTAGCAMGPDYERPEVPVPEGYEQQAVPGESMANLDWWELFDDPILVDLIRAALLNNKEMTIAAARIVEARAALGFVRADQYPNVDGVAEGVRGNILPGVPEPGSINEQWVLAAGVSWEIDLWGKLRRSTESARAQLLATEDARQAVTITLISDVAATYLLLLDLDNQVEISERTIGTREDSLEIIQARYDKGTVPLIDVNQAQIELGDAVANLAQVVRQRERAENRLSVLLGRNPGSILRSDMTTREAIHVPGIPAGLPSELLERRPDVRQAEQELAAQTARIGVAEALRWPSLSLTGTLGLASNELDNFISSDNQAWSLGGSLLGPIFDAGRGRSRVEQERARTEQLISAYELTVLRAFEEVENSLVDIQTFRDEARAREAQTVAAQSAAELSRARYNGGVTSFLEVLESDRSLFRTEIQASKTRRQQVVSLVTLYKALGGGWATQEEEEAAGGFYQATLPPGSDIPAPAEPNP